MTREISRRTSGPPELDARHPADRPVIVEDHVILGDKPSHRFTVELSDKTTIKVRSTHATDKGRQATINRAIARHVKATGYHDDVSPPELPIASQGGDVG